MIEYIIEGVAGVASVATGVSYLQKKFFEPKKPDALGALPFSIYKTCRNNGKRGFECPKCMMIGDNNQQPPICGCLEYPRVHFHFKCADCKFESLLRTWDDK